MKKLDLLIHLLLLFIISSFLTFLFRLKIDIDFGQTIFLFCYFILLSIILLIIYKKYLININCNKFLYIVIASVLSVIICTSNSTNFFKAYQSSSISLCIVDKLNNEKEDIWISDIFIDGESMNLSKISLPNGWIYNTDWNDIISNSTYPDPLKIGFPKATDIEVAFAYNKSFVSKIELNDTNNVYMGNEISLIPRGDNFIYKVKGNLIHFNQAQYLMLNILCFILFSYLIFYLLLLVKKALKLI